MDWGASSLGEAFKLFKQWCELYFSVKGIKSEQQVDHILLLVGEEGLKKYNSWTLSMEEQKKPDVIWEEFKQQVQPKVNFRIARFYLQKLIQKDNEPINDFLARCRIQAQDCAFRDDTEREKRLIELLLTGTCHQHLQKELLSKAGKLSLDQALELARAHDASLTHMRQMAEVQGQTADKSVDAIKCKPTHPTRDKRAHV